MTKRTLWAVFALVTISACQSSTSSPADGLGQPAADTAQGPETLQSGPSEPTVSGSAEVSEAAVILDEVRSATAVIGVDNLVFPATGNEDLLALEPDAVLVGTAGRGFLRKVVSVSQDGEQVTVTTTQATLEDLFDEADFRVEIPMLGDEPMADSACPACDARPWINRSLDGTVLFEERKTEDVNGIAADYVCKGEITEGHVRFAPKFGFDYTKSFFGGLHFLSFDASAYLDAALAVEFIFHNFQLEGEFEIPLLSSSYVLMVGTVPLVVSPQLSLIIDASAMTQQGWGKVSGGVTANGDFSLTVAWDKEGSPKWSGYSSGGFDVDALPFGIDGSWRLEGKLTAAAKLKASLQIYNIAGPYVEIGPNVELNYKMDGYAPEGEDPSHYTGGSVDFVEPFTWELLGGIAATAGVEAAVFGYGLFDWNRTFFSASTKLAGGEIDFGSCEIEEARTCYWDAVEAPNDCQAGCAALPDNCEFDDPSCGCNRAACPYECGAERLEQQARCFDAHGCAVIMGSNTEESVECFQQLNENHAACLQAAGAAGASECLEICLTDYREDELACKQLWFAGLLEKVLGEDAN